MTIRRTGNSLDRMQRLALINGSRFVTVVAEIELRHHKPCQWNFACKSVIMYLLQILCAHELFLTLSTILGAGPKTRWPTPNVAPSSGKLWLRNRPYFVFHLSEILCSMVYLSACQGIFAGILFLVAFWNETSLVESCRASDGLRNENEKLVYNFPHASSLNLQRLLSPIGDSKVNAESLCTVSKLRHTGSWCWCSFTFTFTLYTSALEHRSKL